VSEDGKTRTSANGTRWGATLQTAVRMWPTPSANEDAAGTPNGNMQKMLGNHPEIRGTTQEEWQRGSLNPTWVEWLMGYPIGHTDLKDWVTPSSRKSRQKSSDASTK
jgi:DNA (cytosine-5)-methyltransferase 1